MIIYKIVNKITNKVYIGQTVMPLARRWSVHKASKRKSPLTSSIKKHGIENFYIQEIDRAHSTIELDILEQTYIVAYNSVYPNGYNLAIGGRSSRGHKAWNKGIKGLPPPKSAFKPGDIPRNKGLETSEAAKIKQSKAKLGKHLSPATEFKKGEVSAFKGKKHSEESLALITAANLLRATKVLCVETGEIFQSVAECAAKYNIAKSHLLRLIRAHKKHKGLQLTFIEYKAA